MFDARWLKLCGVAAAVAGLTALGGCSYENADIEDDTPDIEIHEHHDEPDAKVHHGHDHDADIDVDADVDTPDVDVDID